ncbi:hypothetical protein [Streptomyces xinghaiensis]|uniref:hypothetical protein n=1 Tax=Streptomyces xinghaiensis TaxID=1038928 RepID=UPI0039907F1A
MPRGRHRHSPPLHRLLPPSTVIGVSAACAVGALLTDDPVGLRLLVVAAAAAAVIGAVLMRAWDRAAGKQVADLHRARTRDEWRAEERIAELESDVEESRELRGELEAKLRAKRTELARLRNEHAGLLRRYATAETERASALEGRRLLAIEAGPSRPALGGDGTPTPAAYLRASEALRRLARNGARQQAERTVTAARRREAEQAGRGEADEPRGKHAAAAGSDGGDRTAAGPSTPAPREQHTMPAAAAVVPYEPRRGSAPRTEGGFDFFGTQSERAARQRPELTAVAREEDLADVVGAEAFAEHEARQGQAGQNEPAGQSEPAGQDERPAQSDDGSAQAGGSGRSQPAKRTRQTPSRGKRAGQRDEPRSGQGRGPQPLSRKQQSERRQPPRQTGPASATPEPEEPEHAQNEVIDLTEHDETEQLNLSELRAHSS